MADAFVLDFFCDGVCWASFNACAALSVVCVWAMLERVGVLAWSGRKFQVCDDAAKAAGHAFFGDKATIETKGAEAGYIGGVALRPVTGEDDIVGNHVGFQHGGQCFASGGYHFLDQQAAHLIVEFFAWESGV